MCGRIVWVWDAATGLLLQRYDDRALHDPALEKILKRARYNVPPSSHLPIVRGTSQGPRLEVARWGFPIPQRPTRVFNTRVETAQDSPMWRSLLGDGHCLFMVQGFYEWKRGKRLDQPYYIRRADGQPMLLAGLAGPRTVDGASALCASILTCAPNAMMATVHDRMPVVLEVAEADRWVAPHEHPIEDLLGMARPSREGVLTMHPVDPRVGDTDNDDPALIDEHRPNQWF